MFQGFPDRIEYQVVVNLEGQYSLWLAGRAAQADWKAVGRTGSKKTCLAYIEEVWTDMRPLSVHTRMAEEIGRLR